MAYNLNNVSRSTSGLAKRGANISINPPSSLGGTLMPPSNSLAPLSISLPNSSINLGAPVFKT